MPRIDRRVRTGSFTRGLHVSLLVIMGSACFFSPSRAQSRRDPTPEEKGVMLKALGALDHIMTPFLGAHDMEASPSSGTLGEDLSVPIDGRIGTAYTWDSSVKKDSDRYNAHVKPLVDQIIQLTQNGQYEQVKALRQEMTRWNHLSISVELNSEALGLGSAPARNTTLSLSGVDRAFVIAEDDYAPDNKGNRVLAFGNWKTAEHDAKNAAERFHFVHPPQTPFIENMVVIISGAEDLTRELLEKTDWTQVTASLSP